MRKLLTWVHAVLIFLIAIGLRVWNIKSEGPSFEEMLASLTAARPLQDYLASAYPDFCPPAFYAVLHPMAENNLPLWMLRLPSALSGSVAAVLAFFVGRTLFTNQIGLIAGYLLALSPLHIYFSQEVEPLALASLVFFGAIIFCVRAAESNLLKDWLLYDVFLVLLLYLFREAPFLVVTFPLLQLARAAFFPPTEEQRRIRRSGLLQAIAFNHLLVTAVSLPWLSISTSKLPWPLPQPTGQDLMQVFADYYLTGLSQLRWDKAPYLLLLLYILLLPPMIRVIRKPDFRSFAILAGLLLSLGIPFTYSILENSRFHSQRMSLLTLPFFILAVAMLIGRCNPVVRLVLFLAFAGVFVGSTVSQARSLQKVSWTAMRNAVVQNTPGPEDLVVFWPDHTIEVAKYWQSAYGNEFQSVRASDLLTKWADIPHDSRFFFIISQYPSREPHLYTFPGALHQFARSTVLYQDRLNSVVAATDLNETKLAGWFRKPDSLAVLDQPTSQTQFLFAANDPLFTGPSFHNDRPDVSFDEEGRRAVWTRTSHVDLNLTVTLAPGFYIVKLHCSPEFKQPEYGRHVDRAVSVEIVTGADRKKVQLTQESTIRLTTSTDNELRNLKISIHTDPMLKIPPPDGGTFGIKIYSIAIDQADVPLE